MGTKRNLGGKLRVARAAVARGDWFTYVNVPDQFTLQMDRRLLPILAGLSGGEQNVPPALYVEWRRALDVFGEPDENPAQLEVFMGSERVPVYYAVIDGQVYVSKSLMMPF